LHIAKESNKKKPAAKAIASNVQKVENNVIGVNNTEVGSG